MKKYDSDSKVVKNILNGSKEDYRYVVDKYSPMMFHIVRSFEKNDQEVKGIVQEILVKIYTKLDSYGHKAKFSTWIYSIAKNHCRDYAKNIRRKNSRFSEMDKGFIEGELSMDLQPDEHVEQNESMHLLLRAIADLPEEQSVPLLMKYRDGMSYKAISEQMQISEAALKVRQILELQQRAASRGIDDEMLARHLEPAADQADNNMPSDFIIQKMMEGFAKGVKLVRHSVENGGGRKLTSSFRRDHRTSLAAEFPPTRSFKICSMGILTPALRQT